MSRVAGLILQLSVLLLSVAIVLILHNGVWASDAIVVWTAILAVALASIVTSQIYLAMKRSARARQAQRTQRKAPRKPGKGDINHTERFQRSVSPLREAQRQRDREESRRLNIEADIRAMHDPASKW